VSRANKKANGKALWGVALMALVLSGVGYALWRRDKGGTGRFREIRVERGELAINVLSTGTVAPENKLNIQAPIAGRAEQVLVDQGYNVKKGQVLAWVSSTERAALLDGARAEGPEEVKKWEELYKPAPVLAPVDGMIIQRNIQPGQTFATTDAILVMSDHLIVQAQVDETDISQIKLKQDAEIVLDAYPGEHVSGHVDKIAYDAKTVNNVTTYEVDVLPNKVPAFMRSGMTANVSFPAGTKEGILIIPADAIKTKDGHPYVLVAGSKRNEPIRHDIVLGISEGKRVEAASGLSEGDIILEPEFRLTGVAKLGTNPFAAPAGGNKARH
jgi:membrane fusion protein, macrolide-specific efflux system